MKLTDHFRKTSETIREMPATAERIQALLIGILIVVLVTLAVSIGGLRHAH